MPPFRFGTQPMAGAKVTHQRSLQASQHHNPSGESRRVPKVGSGKSTGEGRLQKPLQRGVRRTKGSSQALPRRVSQYKPFVFSSAHVTPSQKLTATQKLCPRLSQFSRKTAALVRTSSQRPAKKAVKATSRSWIFGRKKRNEVAAAASAELRKQRGSVRRLCRESAQGLKNSGFSRQGLVSLSGAGCLMVVCPKPNIWSIMLLA